MSKVMKTIQISRRDYGERSYSAVYAEVSDEGKVEIRETSFVTRDGREYRHGRPTGSLTVDQLKNLAAQL